MSGDEEAQYNNEYVEGDDLYRDSKYLVMVERTLPIQALNKEFMVGDIQFYEARATVADAVLPCS